MSSGSELPDQLLGSELPDQLLGSELPDQLLGLLGRLTCPVCNQLFQQPLVFRCGHVLCQNCLQEQPGNQHCPTCTSPTERSPEGTRALSEAMRLIWSRLPADGGPQAEPGDVECDFCLGFKRKAEKSCLSCLCSYCSFHLERHHSNRRLGHHLLVSPVKDWDRKMCVEHSRPLVLFNTRDQRCICVHCSGNSQDVTFIEEEAQKKKDELRQMVEGWKEKITLRRDKSSEFGCDLQACMDELNEEVLGIRSVFERMNTVLKEAMETTLRPLEERKRRLQEERRQLQDQLMEEVSKVHQTISELEDMSGLEDCILFLQTISAGLEEPALQDWTDVKLDTTLAFGNMRSTTAQMMEDLQQELERLMPLELKRVSKFAVDVRLDPSTAHKHLIVSEDRRSVRDTGEEQGRPEGERTFNTFGSVLGDKRITSGKSYWEVCVGDKTGWELGVTNVDANRKGKLKLNPKEGYWVIALYPDEKFAVLARPPQRLLLRQKPRGVGIFVDRDEGLVSFYDITNKTHIYSFTGCSFGDGICPYFGPHPKQDQANSEPLVISPPQRH